MKNLGLSKNRNSKINRAVIDVVIDAMVEHDSRFISSLGISTETLELLKNLTATELQRLLNGFGAQLINVSINDQAAALFRDHIQAESGNDDTLDQAIRLGARYNMLKELTGVSRQEYENRRSILKLNSPARGRIELLSEADEIRVWDAWQEADHHHPLGRLCLVAGKTKIGIDQVWQTLQSLDISWEAGNG